MATQKETRIRHQVPIIDTEAVGDEFTVYIHRWRKEDGVTVTLDRFTIGRFPTRRKAENMARKLRQATIDAAMYQLETR